MSFSPLSPQFYFIFCTYIVASVTTQVNNLQTFFSSSCSFFSFIPIVFTVQTMGRLFVVNLEGKIYSCKHCHTHLALYDDIYSKVPSLSVPLFYLLYIFSGYNIFNPLLLNSSVENSNGSSCCVMFFWFLDWLLLYQF